MVEQKTRRWPWITAAVVLVLVGLYAAAGFWGLPYLIQSKLPPAIKKQTGYDASLGQVSFNPFTMRMEAHDFVVGKAEPRPLASVKRLVLDLDVASLWHWALVCEEVTLEEPFIKVVMGSDGSLNLAKLVPENKADPKPAEDEKPFPLLLRKLNLVKGSLWFLRQQKQRPGKLQVIPINLQVTDLSTLPELCELTSECGPFTLTAASDQGERLVWRGRVALSPLTSSGMIKLQGWKLATLYEVFPEIAEMATPQGVLDLNAKYTMTMNDDALRLHFDPVHLQVRKLALAPAESSARLGLDALEATTKLSLTRPQKDLVLRLEGLRVSLHNLILGLEGQPPLLTLQVLEAGGGSLDLAQRALTLQNLKLNGGRALVALGGGGKLNWTGLFSHGGPKAGAHEPGSAPGSETPGDWHISLKQAALENYEVIFKDQSGEQPAEVKLRQIGLSLNGLNWPLEQPWPFDLHSALASGGKVSLKGKLISLAPDLEAEYMLEAVDLRLFQPYLARVAHTRLTQGEFTSQGRLALGRPAKGKQLTLEARATLSRLSLRELSSQAELLGFDRLSMPSLHLELQPGSLRMERADLQGPRFKVVIGPKGQINLLQAIKSNEEAQDAGSTPSAKPQAAKEPAFAFQLGVLHINKGILDFSDMSLNPNFSSTVRDLRGSVRDVGNQVTSFMPLRLRGRVDRYGQAKISGRLLPLAPASNSHLKMDFENLDLHHLSPYAAKFAGWRIKEGKLYLEMDYRLEDQRLLGDNRVLIKGLVLGEKIDEPGAPNLPLDLAVALLKDSAGRIEMALPVSGDLADPQVSVGGLIGTALANLVSKIITAPFSWLAGLVGAQGEDLGLVEFEPGSHRVSPPQEEKLAKLAQAMKQRPQLKLDIMGGYNKALDAPVLKRRALVKELNRTSGQEVKGLTQKRVSLSSPAVGRSLKVLYLRSYSQDELRQLKRKASERVLSGGKKATDQQLAMAQNRAMFRALLKKQPLEPGQFQALGQRRSQAAMQLLTGKYGLASSRLTELAPSEQPPTEDKTVPSPLSLATKR
ncbi:MAG: DUF748 domain-containing protein [Deltaproteobacteria bacterium]|nr:DUF748 domain-containing protein [Deltaproteobacteria bacterium]